MVYEIWVIERNKVEILTLYSYLSLEEIKDVYTVCETYLVNLNRGSILNELSLDRTSHVDDFAATTTP